MGRNVARFVSSFKCTSVVTCEVHVDELPISDETGSGQRGRVPRADHAAHEQRGLRGRRGPVRRLPPGRADRSKGPGYAKFIKDGKFRGFFHGQQKLLEQAERQLRAARGTPIEWHLAEASFVQALRRYLAREQITGIRVIHTP
ncbi:Tox-REase-5 domain-containing protein [Haliangium sp.]|uniref:Tox-REase-5 domain-containing protein n=1 Tax=Haliangium sp. TaxID=2663208 RepID=UPI003D0A473C